MRNKKVTIMSRLLESRTEETLNPTEKTSRDVFIREYIKDFNATAACMRMGYKDKLAGIKGCHFLRETYVAKKLDETVRTLQFSDIVTRNQVLAHMWKLANNAYFDSDKIAATAHVAKMLGMDKPVSTEQPSSIPSNVMFIPVMNIQDWQQSARIAQEALKADAAKLN